MDWRKFNFEFRLDDGGMAASLIPIEAYKEAALNLVLPPDWRAQLDRLNRVRAVHGTTALEGNPLSEAEVGRQMELLDSQPEPKESDHITKEQLQIRNAGKAQAWIRLRFKSTEAPLRLSDILTLHKMVTEHSDTTNNIPGAFRTFSVKVGAPDMGGVHFGAPHSKLGVMMENYIRFVHSRIMTESHPSLGRSSHTSSSSRYIHSETETEESPGLSRPGFSFRVAITYMVSTVYRTTSIATSGNTRLSSRRPGECSPST